MDFTLRPITDADLPILFEIYASTRTGELAPVTWWDEAQKRAFLFQQFAAQHQYYLQHYINSSFDVVMVDEQIIGRLYIARWENQIRIIDIGTQLLGRLLEESRTQNLPLTIHVERNNPALAWYHRLGFKMVEDKGVYFLLSAEKSSKD
jgi:GNAT superfamily N-acetyltransferase